MIVLRLLLDGEYHCEGDTFESLNNLKMSLSFPSACQAWLRQQGRQAEAVDFCRRLFAVVHYCFCKLFIIHIT